MKAATAVMRAAETRLDVAARNIANVSAPGYKRQSAYATLVADTATTNADLPSIATRADATQGKLEVTRNPLDLAISGEGSLRSRLASKSVTFGKVFDPRL